MPTEEDARQWLAALKNDELAHHGVLGQKWGHRKDEAPASGISSHEIDAEAKKDAKTHVQAHLDQSKDAEARAQRQAITDHVNKRMSESPEYAKAFAYHQPKAAHAEKVKGRIVTGALVAGAAAYLAISNKDFLERAAGSAALKVAARRGARAAGPILQEIGSKPVISLVKGADGIFRLAA